jgi:hypothetical protein
MVYHLIGMPFLKTFDIIGPPTKITSMQILFVMSCSEMDLEEWVMRVGFERLSDGQPPRSQFFGLMSKVRWQSRRTPVSRGFFI